MPALFLGVALVAGLADVLAALATGARALLVDSDFGFVAAFFATAFFAGFGESSSPPAFGFAAALAGFAAFLAPLALPPPLAARSSSSAIA